MLRHLAAIALLIAGAILIFANRRTIPAISPPVAPQAAAALILRYG